MGWYRRIIMTTIYTYNGQILVDSSDGKWLAENETLVLPPLTIRVKLKDGASLSISNATCTQVSASPNIWDVSTLTTSKGNNWSWLFISNTNITEVLGANPKGNGNIGDVTNIQGMFSRCTSLTTVPLFDTSSISNMSSMLQGCTALTSVPLFDTSSVSNISSMFSGCTSLTSVPSFDTSSVTNMNSMFNNCSSLTSIPLLDTSSVTSMQNTFKGCTALTSIPLLDISSATSMQNMFAGCTSLTTVPLLDTSSNRTMYGMFKGCTALTSIPLFNTSSVTNMYQTFQGCTNVESGALALYQQASTQTTPPTYHDNTFTDCGSNTVTGAAELAQIPSSWGGTGT